MLELVIVKVELFLIKITVGFKNYYAVNKNIQFYFKYILTLYINMNTIVNKMSKEYYESLLKQVKFQNMSSYIEPINNRIDKYNIKENIIEPNTVSETQYSEDYHYKKTWNKLNIVHKKLKLKEFVNNLETDIINKKELLSKLNKMLKTKKITKKNDVIYDDENGRVISIPILKHKDNKYYL